MCFYDSEGMREADVIHWQVRESELCADFFVSYWNESSEEAIG